MRDKTPLSRKGPRGQYLQWTLCPGSKAPRTTKFNRNKVHELLQLLYPAACYAPLLSPRTKNRLCSCPGVWGDGGHVLLVVWDPRASQWVDPSAEVVARLGGVPEDVSSDEDVGPSQHYPVADRRWVGELGGGGRSGSPGPSSVPDVVSPSTSASSVGAALQGAPGCLWGCAECPNSYTLCVQCEGEQLLEHRAEVEFAEAAAQMRHFAAVEAALWLDEARAARQLAEQDEISAAEAAANALLDAEEAAARIP
ncbi:uncharacterized protein LOC127749451 [Frankliniella occidentalis]|uniref:Uncharacterized protein LOC127749451 n=1 Tax=Frankliniella occidentalis TaxID=133901 RepID=A0A9C6TWE7_FRAOC|nr:uncharacterized protein LOC127749451 [Frankliniella occidentalis]